MGIASGLLFGFVGEGEFGFFVEDKWTKETVGSAGTGDVDGYRKNAGYALLKIVDVGGWWRGRRRRGIFVFLFLAAANLHAFRVEGDGIRFAHDRLNGAADV